jgi:hypothetical protein
MNTLFELVKKYGTDKTLSGYTNTYQDLFEPIRDKVHSVLEIGLGTLDPSIPSSFVGNKRLFDFYKQGGSLRVWRDFFTHAKIYGIDIAEDCMFEEERIKTFLFDSSDANKCAYELKNLEFDVIIDDGNHDPKYQVKTLQNLFPLLNVNGYYIIEDIGGYSGTEELLIEYLDQFNSLVEGHTVINKGNHIVIQKLAKSQQLEKTQEPTKKDFTLVTGLWNIGRSGRDFEEHYLPNLENFLKIDAPMVVFIPNQYKEFVETRRRKENTHIVVFELENIKRLYAPFWDKTQEIRTDKKWLNLTGEGGWLKGSPQAVLEWYNPIVQSKMFLLHDASIWNPFDTDYFFWLDAGITNTVSMDHLVHKNALDDITKYANPFLFISYPYESSGEIHGFELEAMNKFAGADVKYVCRGGLFGGHKLQIREANATYYNTLIQTLSSGLMGTEESIFTIMSYAEPELYRRYMIDGNGLISKFTSALLDGTVKLEEPSKNRFKNPLKVSDKDISKLKMSVYMLTFNFTEQAEHTIQTWLKHDKWLTQTRNILIDNSTNEEARIANKALCEKYNFEHIITNENTGINGGRFRAAQHFQESDSDYYLFLEDDMGIHAPDQSGYCRNGFRYYVPNLYDKALKILHGSDIDFLKLSYTEVYMDNNIQVSWYNVPQQVRTDNWPNYDKLPTTGLDPNTPRTKFDSIEVVDGLSYITGDIYYCNWPTICGKKGNQKMFLDTTWARPYEQTWMSHMFQETKKGNLKPAVLLASPINHDRIAHYQPEERREN